MEKIAGVPLAERWETMKILERYKAIDRIVEMEKELGSLQFPAYGSLFLRESVPSEYHRYTLPPALDPAELFCVGPSCDRSMWHRYFANESKAAQDVGPCEHCVLFLLFYELPDALQGPLFQTLHYQFHNEN
jgi:hypothetical protein